MCKTNQTTNEAVDIAAENERIKAELAGMDPITRTFLLHFCEALYKLGDDIPADELLKERADNRTKKHITER